LLADQPTSDAGAAICGAQFGCAVATPAGSVNRQFWGVVAVFVSEVIDTDPGAPHVSWRQQDARNVTLSGGTVMGIDPFLQSVTLRFNPTQLFPILLVGSWAAAATLMGIYQSSSSSVSSSSSGSYSSSAASNAPIW